MRITTQWAVCLAAFAALVATSVRAQEPPSVPTFPTQAEAITVDVVVLGRDGKPVRGLTKADFTVLEDGQPQQVVSFEAREMQTGASKAKAPAAEPVVTNERVTTGRVLALVLDDLGIAPLVMTEVKKAAGRWLKEQADDRDEVTLITTSGDAWWSDGIARGRADLLAVLERVKGKRAGSASEQMSEWEAHQIALDLDEGVAGRVVDRWLASGACLMTFDKESSRVFCLKRVRGLAQQMESYIVTHRDAVFDAVERVSKGSGTGRGRTSIVLFSEGFLRDPEDRREAAAIDAARRANTAIYFVDSRGLIGLTSAFQAAASGPPPEAKDVGVSIFEETTLASAGTENLAEETGGFAITNNNDLNAGLVRVADESATYYLLGYQPSGPAREKWHKLQVRVDRPDVKVRARKGYFSTLPSPPTAPKGKSAGKEGQAKAPEARIDPALLTGGHGNGIPLRLATYVFDGAAPALARVMVALDIATGPFTVVGGEGGGKIALELMLLGASRDKGEVFPIGERIEAKLKGNGPHPEWWTFTREMRLPAGVSQVRALVRDVATGRTGTVVQRFEVPALGGFRISTPILSDRVEASPGGDGRQAPVLVAYRTFRPEGRLYCQYEVFGAKPSGAAGVRGGYSLLRSDGSLIRGGPPTPIAPGSGGRLVRMLGLSLDGLPEGSYELEIHVEGAPGVPPLEAREPFLLTRGDARAGG
jgi:VWFA-related protein